MLDPRLVVLALRDASAIELLDLLLGSMAVLGCKLRRNARFYGGQPGVQDMVNMVMDDASKVDAEFERNLGKGTAAWSEALGKFERGEL